MNYEKIILAHRNWLHYYIRRKVMNEQDTEDLVQKTLVYAIFYINTYEKSKKCRSILQNVANFKIKHYQRDYMRKKFKPFSLEDFYEEATLQISAYDDVPKAIERIAVLENVKEYLDSIDPVIPGCRNIDVLLGDINVAKEVLRLNISEFTIRARIRRLRTTLANKLENGDFHRIKQYEAPTNTNSPIRV